MGNARGNSAAASRAATRMETRGQASSDSGSTVRSFGSRIMPRITRGVPTNQRRAKPPKRATSMLNKVISHDSEPRKQMRTSMLRRQRRGVRLDAVILRFRTRLQRFASDQEDSWCWLSRGRNVHKQLNGCRSGHDLNDSTHVAQFTCDNRMIVRSSSPNH